MRKRFAVGACLTVSFALASSACTRSGDRQRQGSEQRRAPVEAAGAEEAGEPPVEPAPSGCFFVAKGTGPSGATALRAETVVDGLEIPWGIAFLPDGDWLVTERPGRLRRVRQGRLVPRPVAEVDVAATGEGGLLGIALHPDFAQNRLFYLAYTHRADGRMQNRLERWRLSEDGATAAPDRVLLDGLPAHRIHDGGRLRVGPDRRLYWSVGDAGKAGDAQDPEVLAGKILRVGLDGEIPDDNPIPGSSVFLLGVRNSQGFDWLEDGSLVIADHGPSGERALRGRDEVSVAKAGDNLGWPKIAGCDEEEGLITPLISWRQAVPPGGLAVYRGDAIPGWQGNVLLGSLGARQLQRIVLAADGSRVESHEHYFEGEAPEGLGRVREVIVGPEGGLYLSTSNCDGRGHCPESKDRIVRIVPVQ